MHGSRSPCAPGTYCTWTVTKIWPRLRDRLLANTLAVRHPRENHSEIKRLDVGRRSRLASPTEPWLLTDTGGGASIIMMIFLPKAGAGTVSCYLLRSPLSYGSR